MDLLIAEASGTTDAGARSRIELVLRALGVDSTELYPQGSSKAVNNGALLKAMDMSSVTVWAAPYVLLANMQGGVKLTDQQIETLIAIHRAAELQRPFWAAATAARITPIPIPRVRPWRR